MASGVNKVILIGRLGADPESKTVGERTVAQFSLATEETWQDKQGQKQSRTEWHRCVCWGPRGAALARHFKKGDGIYVEGRLQTRKWEDKDGNARYTTEVVVNEWQFLPSSGSSRRDHGDREESQPDQQGPPPSPTDDDIPF